MQNAENEGETRDERDRRRATATVKPEIPKPEIQGSAIPTGP